MLMTRPLTPRIKNWSEYYTTHFWLYRKYGKANHCANDPNHQSLRFEWASVNGKYSKDIKNFRQLCVPCHRKLDMTEKSRKASGLRLVRNTNRRRAVRQFPLEGIFIKKHKSITHTARELGILRTSIMNNLSGRSKFAGNYTWKI